MFMQARHYTKGRIKKIRVLVIHDMEMPEKPTTAEACARMFAAANSPKGSVHFCVDQDSWLGCVRESDTAWGAPGVNADGLHLEHAGYASQTRTQWTDKTSAAELWISAKLVAGLCRKHKIPPVHLTDAQLRAGAKGLIGHVQASHVYGGTHWDPGPNFPWDAYMTMVRAECDALGGKRWTWASLGAAAAAIGLSASVFAGVTSTPTPKPAPKPVATATAPARPAPVKPNPKPKPAPKLKPVAYPGSLVRQGSKGAAVRLIQVRLQAVGIGVAGGPDGSFGPRTHRAVVSYQQSRKLTPDGVVGPKTWRALFG